MTARTLRAVAFAVIVVLLGYYTVTRVRVSADFSAFLPAGASATQRALIQQLREGAAGRLLLIALSGATTDVLADQSRALVARLAAQPQFTYAVNGDAAQLARDLAFVAAHRYALSPGVEPGRFSTEGLRAALERRLEGLYGSAAPLEKLTLAQDPTGETVEVLRRVLPARSPQIVNGVWFDAPGQRALLVAQTAAPASDIEGQAAAVDALLRDHADVAHGISMLEYSSPGALAVLSRAAIAHEVRLLSIVSTVLIVGVLVATYRAPVPVLLCAVPAAVGLLAGVCAVYATLGRLNGITLAFGATLLGEAVDYPSLLLTQSLRGETVQTARRRIGPLLRLAVLTTACGALALLMSGFPGLIELGTLTVAGILAAGVVTWWIVPDWAPAGAGHRLQTRAAIPWRMPGSHALRWSVTAIIVALVWILATQRTPFDDDLAHLNPLPQAYAARDRSLREALGAPDVRALVLVRAGSDQEVLQRAERLRPVLEQAVAADEMEGFDLVSDVMPSDAAQARRRAALPAPDALHASLAAAVAGTPFRLDAFAAFEHDVEAARQAAPLAPADFAGTALGLRLSTLLGRDTEGPYAVVPLRGVKNAAAVSARVARAGEAGVAWLDLREESAAMLGAYRRQVLVATAFGVALIAVVLVAGLRDLRRTSRVLAPVLAATALCAGAIIALGTPLTIFHLVALLLVIGVGVNYALFAERAARDPEEVSRVVRTLGVVAATTLCAFATLAFSRIPVLHALGFTVCTGVIASLATIGWTLLPTASPRRVEQPS
jgi:predicted exporter